MEEKGRPVEFATPHEWQCYNGSPGILCLNLWKRNLFTVRDNSEAKLDHMKLSSIWNFYWFYTWKSKNLRVPHVYWNNSIYLHQQWTVVASFPWFKIWKNLRIGLWKIKSHINFQINNNVGEKKRQHRAMVKNVDSGARLRN